MRLFLLILFASLSGLFAETGSIQGLVPLPKGESNTVPVEKYTGKISGKIAAHPPQIAGVWLESPKLCAPQNPPSIRLIQSQYQFAQSLLIVPTGTTVLFPNDDPDYHNIYSLSRPKRFDLGRFKKDAAPAPSVLFDKAGFISLHCEIHDHMKATIIVVNSPHSTTTTAQGTFTLKNVPAGSYILHAQIDRKTSWKIPVQVVSNKSTRVEFPKK